MVNQSNKLRVAVNKVGSVEAFNGALQKVLAERRKAESVFLDEVEGDLAQKEKFLSE